MARKYSVDTAMRSAEPAALPSERGFTLLEMMIAVAVVAILASVAIPSYTDHVRRGKLTEATAGLSNIRVKMEQHFQDHHTYAMVPGVNPDPCAQPPDARYFDFACPVRNANAFSATASGKADRGVGGFAYAVDHNNMQSTTITGDAAKAGYKSAGNCWVVRKGEGANAC